MTFAHGGDVERVAREAGIPVDRLLDFSANINPMGLPPRAAERLAREAGDPRFWSRYPDPQAPELRTALCQYLAVAPESIVLGAGADSLIHAAVRALAPNRCLIPEPAFCEYRRAAEAFGCEIIGTPPELAQVAACAPHTARRVDDSVDATPALSIAPEFVVISPAFAQPAASARQAAVAANEGSVDAALASPPPLPQPGDLLVVNNPHNPTGACFPRDEILQRIAAARAQRASVLVDEAFIDYAPESAITREASLAEGVVAIRSLTKFFGCPGLRVGYAVAAPETARRLAAQLPPWPITTLAANALAEALQDAPYRAEALRSNQLARTALSAALASLHCRVFPSAANFLLLSLPGGFPALEVRDRLILEHSILVRECDSFAGLEPGRYLRVAVRRPEENARLVEALSALFREISCPTHSLTQP